MTKTKKAYIAIAVLLMMGISYYAIQPAKAETEVQSLVEQIASLKAQLAVLEQRLATIQGGQYQNQNPAPNNYQLGTPVIFSLSSSSGPVGTMVTIMGSNFTPTGNTVHFSNGNVATAASSGGSLTFQVPLQLNGMMVGPGSYNIYVSNVNGISNVAVFTVTGASASPQPQYPSNPEPQPPIDPTYPQNPTYPLQTDNCRYVYTFVQGTTYQKPTWVCFPNQPSPTTQDYYTRPSMPPLCNGNGGEVYRELYPCYRSPEQPQPIPPQPTPSTFSSAGPYCPYGHFCPPSCTPSTPCK